MIDAIAPYQIQRELGRGGMGVVKIFRVGVLMYGKPPTMLTLLKWLKEA